MPKCLNLYCPQNRNTRRISGKSSEWLFQVEPTDLSQISWFWHKPSLKDCLHTRAELTVNTIWMMMRVHKSLLTTNKNAPSMSDMRTSSASCLQDVLHGCTVSLGLWCSSSSLVLGQRQQQTVWFTPAARAWALFIWALKSVHPIRSWPFVRSCRHY